MNRTVVGLSLLVLLGCGAGCGSSQKRTFVRVGQLAPDFALPDMEGNVVKLSDNRGEVVFLRFWADWCTNCKIEMPLIQKKYLKLKDDGFRVLAINVKQSKEVAAKFVRELGLTYTILLDQKGTVYPEYGVIGLPTTFLIDREGVIREKILGDLNEKNLTKVISKYFTQ